MKLPVNWNFLGGRGSKTKNLPWGGVWIYSGTAHFTLLECRRGHSGGESENCGRIARRFYYKNNHSILHVFLKVCRQLTKIINMKCIHLINMNLYQQESISRNSNVTCFKNMTTVFPFHIGTNHSSF